MPDGADRSGWIISNTTPIITLACVGQLNLLKSLYQRVLIPEAVQREVEAGGAHRPGWKELLAAGWIAVTPLSGKIHQDLLSVLDQGEAEAISLALELSVQRVLIDERLGRREALHQGLAVTGSLGILLKAKKAGLVRELRPLLEEMQKRGIRLHPGLVEKSLRLAGELG